jgi:hypothetical protein
MATISAALCLLTLASCASPPAFPVPANEHKTVALDVRLPADFLGTWTTAGFIETLRDELAKYHILVVRRAEDPDAVARIDLGRVTYHTWQEVDVSLDDVDVGRVHVPDLSMTTTDVVAQLVATVIAQRLWAHEPPM